MYFDVETDYQGSVMFCDADGNIWNSDELITYVVSEFGPYSNLQCGNMFDVNWMYKRVA